MCITEHQALRTPLRKGGSAEMTDRLALSGNNGPKLTTADRAALAAYPQPGRIVDLREGGGWVFQPVCIAGELELLTGIRVWPCGWSDAFAIRDLGDAKGFRCDPAGGEVWKREGGLVEVIEGLVELPLPSAPNAPRLVKTAAPTLWTPRS
jgi:hypothetical protein